MNLYVAHVQTGREARVVAQATEFGRGHDAEILWPRRKLTIRRKGVRRESLAPVFPGYLFVKTESLSTDLQIDLKRIDGFYRFLESNDSVRPLTGRDFELVAHFLKFGEVVGKSEVRFDKDSRIQVLDGPLVGLEGQIVSVDKRKRRAKIKLDLYRDSFLIDLGFEIIASAVEKPGAGAH